MKLNKKGFNVDYDSQFNISSINIDRANSEIEESLFEKGRIFLF